MLPFDTTRTGIHAGRILRGQNVKRTHIAAALVAALFVLWLLSGQLGEEDDSGPAPSVAATRDAMLAMDEDDPTRVRARVIRAESRTADVVVRGRTEADRSVSVLAETSGPVVELPVDKGDRVEAGDVLCRIRVDARDARIEEAREAVEQARIEYQGALRLAEKGYQSETAIAGARARLAARRADLQQRELDLEHTHVRAPFAGIVEERPVELGAFLQSGNVCARIIDPDPMMLVGQVAEREVGRIRIGDPGHGRLITGESVTGEVAFAARSAAASTRTFRVEVAVPNPDADLRSGITTEIRLPVGQYRAHHLSSALLALDDSGRVGVRILDESDRVRFVNVDVISDTGSGIWVSGLPNPATVITVGQELVTPGEQVEVTFEAGGGMPASRPESSASPPQPERKDRDENPEVGRRTDPTRTTAAAAAA